MSRGAFNMHFVRYAAVAASTSFVTFFGVTESDRYCDGFRQGFYSVTNGLGQPPQCPVQPQIPSGSTAFNEGMKAGVATALNRN